METEVQASPSRVWRALCDPAEVIRWDTGVEAALDAPSDYPQPGHSVRWRCRSGPFRVLLDRPVEVIPERTLRSLLSLGPFRFDETYTLSPTNSGCSLSADLAVSTALPIAGGFVDRLYLGPKTRRDFEASLAAIKRHCEAG